MSAVITGFELASRNGPLCEEPIVNVHFIIDSIVKLKTDGSSESGDPLVTPLPSNTNTTGSISASTLNGLLISTTRDACRDAVLRRSTARLCEPVVVLDVQGDQLLLGKVYGVLLKRRAQVMDEELCGGTSTFQIKLKMPLVETFGLSGELRHQGSGEVHYHAQFAGFELISDDPFPEFSRTDEDAADEGDLVDGQQLGAQNTARKILSRIRKRKGLAIDEKVVKDSNKQRTMTRMK